MTDLVAVVDLGSNAARFTLARITPGREFRVLREDRVQTRLGAGRGNGLPPDAIASTVKATRRFLRSVARAQSPRVVAIATAAVRDASNAGRLLSALRETAGVELEILSGEDEARLGAAAALASLASLDRRVEIAFPVLDTALQAQIWTTLETQLGDTVKARRILPDGRSVRVDTGAARLRSQERLYELTAPSG